MGKNIIENDEAMMKKAIKALQSLQNDEMDSYSTLLEKVRETARKGVKTEFTWRHLRIAYFVRDEFGNFKNFRFHVTNPLTGVQKYYYTKDFMGVTGTIKWATLASRIKNT